MGELRLPAEVVRRVFTERRSGGRMGDVGGLTPREREILTSFASGMSYARIAAEREVQSVTVRNAVYGIQHKLGIKSMQELVLWAAQNGLVEAHAKGQLGHSIHSHEYRWVMSERFGVDNLDRHSTAPPLGYCALYERTAQGIKRQGRSPAAAFISYRYKPRMVPPGRLYCERSSGKCASPSVPESGWLRKRAAFVPQLCGD